MQRKYQQVTYWINRHVTIMRDGSMRFRPLLLGDNWEQFGEEDLEPYFNTSYLKFINALDNLRTLARPVTESEEKNLKIMLDSLIYTKNSIYSGK